MNVNKGLQNQENDDALYGQPCYEMASEYAMERRAIRRAAWWGRVRAILVMTFAVLLVYGVLGYLVFGYFPDRISKELPRHGKLQSAAEEVSRDCENLQKLCRLEKWDGNEGVPFERFRSQLADPGINRLAEVYLGHDFEKTLQCFEKDVDRVLGPFVKDGKRASDLMKTIHDLEVKRVMASREFNGPVGTGSRSWRDRMSTLAERIETLQRELSQVLYDSPETRAQVNAATQNLVKRYNAESILHLRQTLEERRDALRVRGGELELLRTWRSRLCVWPLSAIERFCQRKGRE